MLIPQCVYDKYDKVATAMIDELGIDCTVVYPVVNVPTSQSVPFFKQKNTLLDTTDNYGFKQGGDNFISAETTEIVKLRIYWREQDWKKLANISLPQGSVMAIGFLYDLGKLSRADHILIHTEVSNDFKFYKAAEPVVHGLTSKYLMSFWKRNAE